MTPITTSQSKRSATRGQFTTTHWSLVLAAGSRTSPKSTQALAVLCETYWYPLYAYVRRAGRNPEDAQDLTQEFFTRLLEKHYLDAVRREKGRFRSFLLASLKHFLANEWDKAQTQKRGGGRSFIRLDDATAESRYKLEPRDDASADKLYERRWALTLLDRVLARLREEHAAAGKAKQFDALKAFIGGERGAEGYAAVGAALGMSEANVKVTVHRLRKRYRDLLRDEIAQTVGSEAEIEDEIRQLFATLSS
jgi:RNA polymerase sigma-70 factor (ECF subfamily)